MHLTTINTEFVEAAGILLGKGHGARKGLPRTCVSQTFCTPFQRIGESGSWGVNQSMYIICGNNTVCSDSHERRTSTVNVQQVVEIDIGSLTSTLPTLANASCNEPFMAYRACSQQRLSRLIAALRLSLVHHSTRQASRTGGSGRSHPEQQ